eukprot:COSAG02_NODE_2263_length_9312_cov_3.608054_9_plen_609_part_00
MRHTIASLAAWPAGVWPMVARAALVLGTFATAVATPAAGTSTCDAALRSVRCPGNAASHPTCWDDTYTFERCCANAPVGDPTCWDGGPHTYASCCTASEQDCLVCTGRSQHALRNAGCTHEDIVGFCSSGHAAPTPCPSGYQIRGSCVPPGVSPLDYYVNRVQDVDLPPPRVTQTLSSTGGCALTVVNFTSQRWLTDADFKQTSAAKSVWSHRLIVAAPPNPENLASTGWLWITGGHNPNSSPISPSDSEVEVACALALSSNTIGAVLHQVPNQPVQFARDIPHSSQTYPDEARTEDGIIAYTWNHFCFEDSTSPEWLLRLPMTKAVSRAMDVLQDRHPELQSFVVGGASKRGWTTWTTGLVEKRTKAIVPVVMDLLNLVNGTDNHYRSLGGYTFEFADYLEAGVVGTTLHTQNYSKLADIIDPYSYFKPNAPWRSPSFDNMPKLVVNAANDEFFLPDDDHQWWRELPGEKHRLYVPNADHPFRFLPPFPPSYVDGTEVFASSLLPFFGAVVRSIPRPSFSWSIAADGASITAGSFSVPPANVTLWTATTRDHFRDFRLFNCRTGPSQNCTHYEGDPGTAQPVRNSSVVTVVLCFRVYTLMCSVVSIR